MLSSSDYIAQFDSLFARAKQHGNNGNNKAALPYARRAYEAALLSADSFRIVRGGRTVSQLLLRLSQENEALEFLIAALPIAERNGFEEELSIIYNSLGIYYAIVADYHKALIYHFKSLEIRQAGGDDSETSISFHNLGFVYYKLQDYTLALENFNNALTLKKKSGDNYDLPILLVNISLCHSNMGNDIKARKALDSSLLACGPYCSPSIKMQQEFASGILSYLDNQIEEAESCFVRSYELAMNINDNRFQAENLFYFARIASYRSNPKKALKHLKLLEKICLNGKYNRLLERAYRDFVAIHRKLGRHQEAWLYQDRYLAIKDKIFNEQIANKLLQVHSEYAARNRQLLKNHNQQILARQRTQNIMAVTIVVILIFLTVSLYFLVKEKQRINVQLGGKVEERTRALELNELRLSWELSVIDSALQKGHRDFRAELASMQGIRDHLSRAGRSSDSYGVAGLLDRSISRLDILIKTVFSSRRDVISHQKVELSQWVQTLYDRIVEVKADIYIEQLTTHQVWLPRNHSVLLMTERILHGISVANFPVKLTVAVLEKDGGKLVSFRFVDTAIKPGDPMYIKCVADGRMLGLPIQFRPDASGTELMIPIYSLVSQLPTFNSDH